MVLGKTDLTITGDNAIAMGALTTGNSTVMSFLADATGFGKITTSGSMNVTLCDGSVIGMSYSIDLFVFAAMGNRMDGQVFQRNF